MAAAGRIRVGVGGWTYAPWRGTFYPAGLPQQRELHYASRQLTAIEINGTFYRLQSAASYAKWRDETPDDFAFTVKAPRHATHRTVLAEAGPSIERFLASGVLELGHKLGAILWQFPPSKRYEPDDFERFLELLPRTGGLRHALDARHESFLCEDFIAAARRHGLATVYADTADYPSYADLTGDFVYARLMRCAASTPTGYPAHALAEWARRAACWARGQQPDDVPLVSPQRAARAPRDVYLFFISGAKERAPAAAQALIARISP